MHLRALALGYTRTEVNKSPYLFSYMLTHGFPTPQASDKETELIFMIAVIYSPRFLIIRYFGGALTQKTTSAGNSCWVYFWRSRRVPPTLNLILHSITRICWISSWFRRLRSLRWTFYLFTALLGGLCGVNCDYNKFLRRILPKWVTPRFSMNMGPNNSLRSSTLYWLSILYENAQRNTPWWLLELFKLISKHYEQNSV
jgi:hypothetical protein